MHTRKLLLLIAATVLMCLGVSAQTARLNHRYDMFKSIATSDAQIATGFESTVFVGTSVISQFPWEEAIYPELDDAETRRVIDRGVWQATILDVLNNIESIIALHPKRIFLMAGVNDGMDDAANLDVFEENYRQVLHRLKNETDADVVVLSILPATADGRKRSVIHQANTILQRLVGEDEFSGPKFTYKDLYSTVGDVTDPDISPDGLHFNIVGYNNWVNEIKSNCSGYHFFNENNDFVLNTNIEKIFGTDKMAIGDLRNSFYANMSVDEGDVLLIGGETICCGNWSELLGNYRVLNRGYGWDDADVRISQVKRSLPYILGRNYKRGENKPKRIVLYVGGGDLGCDTISTEQAIKNYADLVNEIRLECPSTRITLAKLLNITTITGVDDAKINAFNNAMINLVKAETNIDLIDLRTGKWYYVDGTNDTPNEITTDLTLYTCEEEDPTTNVYIEKASEESYEYIQWSSTNDAKFERGETTSVVGWTDTGVTVSLIEKGREEKPARTLRKYEKDGNSKWVYVFITYDEDGDPVENCLYATIVPETYSEGIPAGYTRTDVIQNVTKDAIDLGITLHKYTKDGEPDIWIEEEYLGTTDVYYLLDENKNRQSVVNISDYKGYYSSDISFNPHITRYYKTKEVEYWLKETSTAGIYDFYEYNPTLNKYVVVKTNQTIDYTYQEGKTESQVIGFEYEPHEWSVTAASFNINDTNLTDGKYVYGPGYLRLAGMLGELLENIDGLTVNVPVDTYEVVNARDVLAGRVLMAETRAKAYDLKDDSFGTKKAALQGIATGGYNYLKQDHTATELTAEATSVFNLTYAEEPSSSVSELVAGWYQIINIDAHTYNAGEGRVLAADDEQTMYGGQPHDAVFTTESANIRSFIYINPSGTGSSRTVNLQLINGRYIGANGASSATSADVYATDDAVVYPSWKVITLKDANNKPFDMDRSMGKLVLMSDAADNKSYYKVFSVSDIVSDKYKIVNVVINEAPEGTTVTYNGDGYAGLPVYNGGYFFVEEDEFASLNKEKFTASITEVDGVQYELNYSVEDSKGTVKLSPKLDFEPIAADNVKATGWFQFNVLKDPSNNKNNTEQRYICAQSDGKVAFTLAKAAPTTYVRIEESVYDNNKVFLRTIDGKYLRSDGTTVNTATQSICEFSIEEIEEGDSDTSFKITGCFGSLESTLTDGVLYLTNGDPNAITSNAITFQACSVASESILRIFQVTTNYTGDGGAQDMSNIKVTYNPEGGYLGLPVTAGGYICLKSAFNAADFNLSDTPDGYICTVTADAENKQIVINVKKINELSGAVNTITESGWYQVALNCNVGDAGVPHLGYGNALAFNLDPAEGATCGRLTDDTESLSTYLYVNVDAETNKYTLRMPNGLYIDSEGKGSTTAYGFTFVNRVENEEVTTDIRISNDASNNLSIETDGTNKVLTANNDDTYFNFFKVTDAQVYTVTQMPDGVEMLTWTPAAGYTGSSVCVAGGVFFAGSAPEEGDLRVTSSAVASANGYADTQVSVNEETKEISVRLRDLTAFAVAKTLQATDYATVKVDDVAKASVDSAIAAFEANNDDANFNNLKDALSSLEPTFTLEDGHAYHIAVANPAFGENYAKGMAYLSNNTGSLFTTKSVTGDINGNSIFLCRKVGDGYILVTHTGNYYMTYRSNSSQSGTTNGYDEENNILAIDSLNGDYRKLLGLVTISVNGDFITLTDDAENPQWKATGNPTTAAFGKGYSSAFLFEDVTESDYYADSKVKFNEVSMLEEGGESPKYAYATKHLPYSYELPEGMVAFYVPEATITTDQNFTIRPIKYNGEGAHVVPANTAVILRVELTQLKADSTTNKTYVANSKGNKVYTLLPATEAASITNEDINTNVLKGTCMKNTAVASVFDIKYDVLGIRKKGDEIIFGTMSKSAKEGILPKAKAFLGVDLAEFSSQQAAAKALANAFMNISDWSLGEGLATDINAVESNACNNNAIYDLSGRKVENNKKGGIYIINGKKVVIK